MSNMLSTSISGRPVRFSSSTRRMRQPQIGGIGDAEHEIGQRLAGGAAEHDVAGDLLVGAAAAQRIGAGQVDQRHLASARRDERAFLALHRDARIVRDLLPAAGQRIEQRGLAAVRRADQGEMQSAELPWIQIPVTSGDDNGHGLAPAHRDGDVLDAHRDRIAADDALMQHLDPGALDEAEFDQPAFEFDRPTAPSRLRRRRGVGSRPRSRAWPVPAAIADARRSASVMACISNRRPAGQARRLEMRLLLRAIIRCHASADGVRARYQRRRTSADIKGMSGNVSGKTGFIPAAGGIVDTDKQEARMTRSAIRLVTLAMFSVALIAASSPGPGVGRRRRRWRS